MSLTILVAGCPKSEKGRIEGVVRKALGSRSESGPWRVSLVKMGQLWSITMDGPEPQFRGLNLSSPEEHLCTTIVRALDVGRPDKAMAEAEEVTAEPSAEVIEKRDRYKCPKCGRPFIVSYTALPNEPSSPTPVACPHCWQVTQVKICESAAATEQYRAEAAPA